MASDNSWNRHRPRLDAWADVDPARHPFDPAGVLTVVQSLAPPVASPVQPTAVLVGQRAAWSEYRAARDEAFRWSMAMNDALVDRYGSWAYGWYWSPGVGEYDGELVSRWDFWEPISTPAAETLLLVADALVQWRRWLQDLAVRFDRFLPSLRRGGTDPGDAAAWKAAIAHLLTSTVARIADEDAWQGLCRRVLTWFRNAAGVPEQRSMTMIDKALDTRFDGWVALTAADVVDVAEQLAGQVTKPANDQIPRTGQGVDDWPDTWPQGWPSWRARPCPVAIVDQMSRACQAL